MQRCSRADFDLNPSRDAQTYSPRLSWSKGRKAVSDVALAKLLPAGITCHGFRSSFRTWAGEMTDYAREVIKRALAHRLGDAVEQAYARGDLFLRRRKLMTAWAAHCAGVKIAECAGTNAPNIGEDSAASRISDQQAAEIASPRLSP
jgi:integrase